MFGTPALAQNAPCSLPPADYGKPGAPPTIKILRTEDIARTHWSPPVCSGWSANVPTELVVRVSGSFHFDGGVEGLLTRMGAISTLPKVRYWSPLSKAWRPVASEASALRDANPASRRADFQAAEIAPGAKLYYWERNSRFGEIVTRITVLERDASHAVITTENVTPVKYWFVTLSEPATIQTLFALTRASQDVWDVTVLDRIGRQSSSIIPHPENSVINRAVAAYRRIAGIPTDQEPPAAP